MKIFSLYRNAVCIAELVQPVQPDVVLPEYEAFVRNCCTLLYFRNDTQIIDCFKLLQDNEPRYMYIRSFTLFLLICLSSSDYQCYCCYEPSSLFHHSDFNFILK